MRGTSHPVRAIALFGAAAIAVHQLRYAIAYGDAAPQALASHNHAYMSFALPAVASVFVMALAALLIRVARGRAATPGGRMSLVTLSLCCALLLGTLYGVQETLEGAGALAGGGWIGFALAFPAGFLVALALRGADAAELRVPSARLRIHFTRSSRIGVRARSRPRRLLDLRVGARAPPAPCVV